MRVMGLNGRAVAVSLALGALLGWLYVWGPWRGEKNPCTTLDDGVQACMPILVVPPPLWVYIAFAFTGAVVALTVTAVAVEVHRRVAEVVAR